MSRGGAGLVYEYGTWLALALAACTLTHRSRQEVARPHGVKGCGVWAAEALRTQPSWPRSRRWMSAAADGEAACLSVLLSRCLELVAVDVAESGEAHNVSSNPYAQVSLPGLPKHKSRTVQRTLDPVFDEQFEFDVSGLSAVELNQIKLKVVVRHQADPARERTTSDPYLGRADIAVAELLARRGEEAAAAGDQVSAAEDTWPLSDPAFKVKSKHLRNKTRKMAVQDIGSPRSPSRHRHPYGTVQLWAEYLPTGPRGAGAAPTRIEKKAIDVAALRAQEQEQEQEERDRVEASTAEVVPADNSELEAAKARLAEITGPIQGTPPPASRSGTDLFDDLATGMLRDLNPSASGAPVDVSDWSGKAMLDAILSGAHKAPVMETPDGLLGALARSRSPSPLQANAPYSPPPGAIYTPSYRPPYTPGLASTVTPIASMERLAKSLSPVTALTPAAREAKELAEEIMGDLETTNGMSEAARSARELAAEILSERGAELENTFVENQALRTDAMAAVDLERTAREHAETLARQSAESTERAEAHISAMEEEANERMRKHEAHASALKIQYESRLEEHRCQHELHVGSIEESFRMEHTAAKDEAAKYQGDMSAMEVEHEGELASHKNAYEMFARTQRVHVRWVALMHKLNKDDLMGSVEEALQRAREAEAEAARHALSTKEHVDALTEEMMAMDKRHQATVQATVQAHAEIQLQTAEERREQVRFCI